MYLESTDISSNNMQFELYGFYIDYSDNLNNSNWSTTLNFDGSSSLGDVNGPIEIINHDPTYNMVGQGDVSYTVSPDTGNGIKVFQYHYGKKDLI